MTTLARGTIVVVGAGSQLTIPLSEQLQRRGYQVTLVSRSPATEPGGAAHVFDANLQRFLPDIESADAIISLAPLPYIDRVLDMARILGTRRVIAFGSTGVFSKANSTSPVERQFVDAQRDAEMRLAAAGERGVLWTLFRPTMIYGANADQNVTFIRSMIRRFRCFPVPFGASGMRQPVHVRDLVDACVAALENPVTFRRAYNLGGGEVLLYEDMVRRICEADGRTAVILAIPKFLFYLIVLIAQKLPGLGYLRVEMVDRMFADLVADNSAATADFGYSPGSFDPPPLARP